MKTIVVKARVLCAKVQISNIFDFLKNFEFFPRKSQIFYYHSELEEILKNHQKCSHFRLKIKKKLFFWKPGRTLTRTEILTKKTLFWAFSGPKIVSEAARARQRHPSQKDNLLRLKTQKKKVADWTKMCENDLRNLKDRNFPKIYLFSQKTHYNWTFFLANMTQKCTKIFNI